MKKVLVIIITVAVLVILVVVLNHALPPPTITASTGSAASADTPKEPTVSVDDLVLAGLDGKSVKLTDLRGKVVLIDFWGTWCDPCKIETPWLIEFQKKYASRGFTVLGVAMDPEGKKLVGPFVQNTRFDVGGVKEAINYPIFLGNDSLSDKFGLEGYPTGILVARDGHVVKTTVGLVSKEEMAKDIESQF